MRKEILFATFILAGLLIISFLSTSTTSQSSLCQEYYGDNICDDTSEKCGSAYVQGVSINCNECSTGGYDCSKSPPKEGPNSPLCKAYYGDNICDDVKEKCGNDYKLGISLDSCQECSTSGFACTTVTKPTTGPESPLCQTYGSSSDPYCDDTKENCASSYVEGISEPPCQECSTGKWKDCKMRRTVLVFVDSNTYSQITDSIEQYLKDIDNSGLKAILKSGNWQSALEVRNEISKNYISQNVVGAVLIGNIPTAYFEDRSGYATKVASDYYYMDLDNNFKDTDNNGKFEPELYQPSDSTLPEIWVGRIKPPVGGQEGINLFKNYFTRNHAYRTGQLSFTSDALVYAPTLYSDLKFSEDSYKSAIKSYISPLYTESSTKIISPYTSFRTADIEYLDNLKLSYEFALINVHGDAVGQYVYDTNKNLVEVIDSEKIKEIKPKILFFKLMSCSNGDFETQNYLAGNYLFYGNSLAGVANTVVVLTGFSSYDKFLMPLNYGGTFGDAYKYDAWTPTTLLGDPTLIIREQSNAKLDKYSITLDFGEVKVGSKKLSSTKIKNVGSDILEFDQNFWIPTQSWVGERVFFSESVKNNIQPDSEQEIVYSFNPKQSGSYKSKEIFLMNDPNSPFLEINLIGQGVQ